MNSYFVVFVAVLYATITSCRVSSSGLRSSTPFLGAQTINVLKLSEADSFKLHDYGSQEAFSVKEGYDEFPELYFTQPLDHFSADIHNTFKQRYWHTWEWYEEGKQPHIFDSSHPYIKVYIGGPIILFTPGESSADGKGHGARCHISSSFIAR